MIVDEWPLGFLGTDRKDYAGDQGGCITEGLKRITKIMQRARALADINKSVQEASFSEGDASSCTWGIASVCILFETAGRIVVVTTGSVGVHCPHSSSTDYGAI